MEDSVNKKPKCIPHSTPSPLAMHKNSQTIISKTKPKIRIIHIFAPEIIKTDVENFRELVQRLTGKPDDNQQKGCKKKRTGRNPTRRREEEPRRSISSVFEKPVMVTKKVEIRSTFLGLEAREKVKEEEEMVMWNGANSGGFLNGFADFDGFIQELGEFPLLPMDASNHMHGLI